MITRGTGNLPAFCPAKSETNGPGCSLLAAAKTKNLIASSDSSVSIIFSLGIPSLTITSGTISVKSLITFDHFCNFSCALSLAS